MATMPVTTILVRAIAISGLLLIGTGADRPAVTDTAVPQLQTGDVVFQHIPGWIGSFIADLTPPRPSRPQTIVIRDGRAMLVLPEESAQQSSLAELTRCAVSNCGLVVVEQGEPYVLDTLDTVRYWRFADWQERGLRGEYLQMRPLTATRAEVAGAVAEAHKFLGTKQDLKLERDDQHVDGAELVYKAYLRGAQLQVGSPQPLADLAWKNCESALRFQQGGDLRLIQPVVTPMVLIRGGQLQLIYSSLTPLMEGPLVPSELPHRMFAGQWIGQFQFDDGRVAAVYVEFGSEGEFFQGWLLMPNGERQEFRRFGLIPLDASGEFLAEISDHRDSQIQVRGMIRDNGIRLWGAWKSERGPRGILSLARVDGQSPAPVVVKSP